jgi:DUF3093 family protein
MAASEPLYVERLHVPVVWWVLAALLALTCAGAVGFYLGPAWGIGVGLVVVAASALVLGSSMVAVVVTPTELRVGRGVLELAYVARCRALTVEETADRSGPGADARAHLVLRPYVPTAVEVTLDDPVDPVPYWLVSSRSPRRLAAAVQAALGSPVPAAGEAP